MLSIRTKLIIFLCLLIIIIDTFICLFFLFHSKKEQEKALEKLGKSLVLLLAQDSEVIHGLSFKQPAFFDSSIKMVETFDREGEIEYWRIASTEKIMIEGKSLWSMMQMDKIPICDDTQGLTGPLIHHIKTDAGEVVYDFSLPVFDKQVSPDEVFATQILSEDKIFLHTQNKLLGFVNIGLSTRKINERIHEIVLFAIIPIGSGVMLAGVCMAFFLNRYFVAPLQRLTRATLEIPKGNINQVVDVRADDEIGQLARNFNQMTKEISTSYAELRREIGEHKQTSELLAYRLKMEELVATLSADFINFAPEGLERGINHSLKMLGEFAGVDRCYVFLLSDDRMKFSNTHEWCREGIAPQINNLQEIPVKYFPWWMERINRFETILVPRVADLPKDAQAEKEVLQAQSVQSLVVIPLVYGGQLMGFLGFDSVVKEILWTDRNITLLKIVGELLVNAIEHRRKEGQLQKAHDELEIRVEDRTRELLKINNLLNLEIAVHKKAREGLRNYEILFSQITDLPYICDANGNILYVNYMFEKLTGRKSEEFIGRSFEPLFDGENLEKARNLYTRTLQGESPQAELSFKDTGVICEYKNLPLRDEWGNIVGVLGSARDITDRKRMEDMLRETNQTLLQAKEYAEKLIETANAIVMGLDHKGNICVFNHTAEELTGYKREEIIGKNCFETIILKNQYPFVWEMFTKWQSGGILFKTFESLVFTKTGGTKYVSWQNSEIKEHGRRVGTISFGIDITERQKMKALVERMRLTSFVKDVSVAFTKGDTLQEMLSQCTEAIVYGLEVMSAHIWIYSPAENALDLQASAGGNISFCEIRKHIPCENLKFGLVNRYDPSYLTRLIYGDILCNKESFKRDGVTSFTVYPLSLGGRLVGVVAMFGNKPFTEFVSKSLISVLGILALGIDRKRAEETLRVSENKYRMLLENLPQRIFYKDVNSRYVSCNENFARDLGIRPEEITGKSDYDFFHEDLANKYIADDKRVMRSGKTEDIEEKYIRDGRELVVQTVKTPLKDEKGVVIGILGIFWDITEKVALQMETLRTRHLVSLGELAAGVAHEINNPVNGIINCAQILVDKTGKGTSENDIAGRIMREGNRITNIVSSLLSFARSSDGREEKTMVDVREVLSETLVLVEAQLQKDGIKTQVDVSQRLPKIFARFQSIQQVFLNIISNARYALNQKYPEVHDDKTIGISGEEITIDNRHYVRITFLDRGIGIPARVIDKVMNPFFTLKPRGKGTGLGLSISHGITGEHGGKLAIESAEGEFTRVVITLPVFKPVGSYRVENTG